MRRLTWQLVLEILGILAACAVITLAYSSPYIL